MQTDVDHMCECVIHSLRNSAVALFLFEHTHTNMLSVIQFAPTSSFIHLQVHKRVTYMQTYIHRGEGGSSRTWGPLAEAQLHANNARWCCSSTMKMCKFWIQWHYQYYERRLLQLSLIYEWPFVNSHRELNAFPHCPIKQGIMAVLECYICLSLMVNNALFKFTYVWYLSPPYVEHIHINLTARCCSERR